MDDQAKYFACKRVVVTRPKEQSVSWMERIVSANREAVFIPALEILPVPEGDQSQRIKEKVLKLDEYAALIFVSQNAVNYGFDWIENFWPQLPEKLSWLAIGTKTHESMNARLASFGVVLPPFSSERMNSEELLELPQLNDVKHKKILIFRGAGGRTKLYEVLSEREAIVEYCELYDRLMPENALDQLREKQLSPTHDILTFFSGETLENFHTLLEQSGIEHWQTFSVIVPSLRVYDLAKKYGFSNVVCAKNASEDAMWDVLCPYLSET